MCLCIGTSGPDEPARVESKAAGKRHDMAICLVILAALAVNLTASIVYLGS